MPNQALPDFRIRDRGFFFGAEQDAEVRVFLLVDDLLDGLLDFVDRQAGFLAHHFVADLLAGTGRFDVILPLVAREETEAGKLSLTLTAFGFVAEFEPLERRL